MLFLPMLRILSSDMPVKLIILSIMLVERESFWHFLRLLRTLASSLVIGGAWKQRETSVASSTEPSFLGLASQFLIA
jgi:hypothetical protein